MNRILVVSAAFAVIAGLVGPIRSQELKRVRGADLFIDLQQYAGKQVLLLDSQIFNISNHGGNLTSGGVDFYLSVCPKTS